MDDKWNKNRQPKYSRIKLLQALLITTVTRPGHYLHPRKMAIQRHDDTKFRRLQINKTTQKKWNQRRNRNVHKELIED